MTGYYLESKQALSVKPEDITVQQLLTLTQEELFAYLKQSLPLIERHGKMLLLRPPMPEGRTFRPLVCSHLDTVTPFPPTDWELVTFHDTVMLSKFSKARCLGADDRAGVYIMLQLIFSEERDKYSYAFFKDEEGGCKGSGAFVDTEIFKNLELETSCYIGVDRKCDPGKPEYATYGCDDKELIKVLEDQLPRFKQTGGSFTDCSTLSENSEHNLPCFNLTAGYNNEHSPNETLHIPTMLGTLDALMELDIPDKQFEFVYVYQPMSRFNWRDWDYGNYEGYGETKKADTAEPLLCDICRDHNLLYEVVEDDGTVTYVCEFCQSEYYQEDEL